MAELAKLPVILDPLFDQLGGFRIQVEVDGLAAEFACPLIVRPVQSAFGHTTAVGFAAAVEAILNASREDIAQPLDLRFERLIFLAQLGQLGGAGRNVFFGHRA